MAIALSDGITFNPHLWAFYEKRENLAYYTHWQSLGKSLPEV